MFDFYLGRKLSLSRLRRDRMNISSSSSSSSRRRPRLDRRNAVKNIDYDAPSTSGPSEDLSPTLRASRSLDLEYSGQTSFRIGGSVEGEFDLLCRILGLSGPEDFSISTAAWEASKARSASFHPPSRLLDSPTADLTSPPNPDPVNCSLPDLSGLEIRGRDGLVRSKDGRIRGSRSSVLSAASLPSDLKSPKTDRPAAENSSLTDLDRVEVRGRDDGAGSNRLSPLGVGGGSGGIRGVRPPILSPPPLAVSALAPPPASRLQLAPPPVMPLRVVEKTSSAWDIVRSFAPDDEDDSQIRWRGGEDDDGDEAEEVEVPGTAAEVEEVRLRETAEDLTGSCCFSTSNDDDTSSTTTETTPPGISPNGKFQRIIQSWEKGGLLGSGSFGTVYEGISDDGSFFAVKEVSLLDQGTNAKQCIFQLEQEIALLSQFEHENIVQYYGTSKEEATLFIFLEIATKGSLASLYQKYRLRDSQVSAYTRQILNGLKYLHDRNVVHRDIKCTNILVHANGSVKLADFGLAKEITKINVLKSCKGSVYWMAPEVIDPKKTYGPSADIWSLGCTVLEMLTGQVPYPDLEWTTALFKICRGLKPDIPDSLSSDARDFISRCVQVNPDDRPTASQLLEHPYVKISLSGSESSDGSSHGGRWR